MNNRYFATLLCITVLAFAPACSKRQEKAAPREDINTMIESEATVFEVEEDIDTQNSIVKF
jgi:hypothetical protein